MVVMATIRVKSNLQAAINPFIYGNFMEFIERHISGMWAEMIENRRMEVFQPEKSTPENWQPYMVNNTAQYALSRQAYSGTVCQRIECIEHNGGFSGILQKGIGVTKGRAYTGTVHLRGLDVGHVEIAVGRDYGPFFLPYATATVTGITKEWQKFRFSFTSDAACDDAEFIIRFPGQGTLWIDHPSLMPADNMDGWRKDVVELTRTLKPGILRFPGGCYADTYHWQYAIGERDLRKPQSNYYWSDVPLEYSISDHRTRRHWQPTEPNDVGIDEFMRFCRLTGSEALIVVNMGTGTPEEAAAWVEHCAPYGVKYWQIGNEMYGNWEIGYSGRDGYIKRYKAFHAAMSAADPDIRFVINGHDSEWNRAMLSECAGLFDYIDIHFYPGWEIEPHANPLTDVFNNFVTRLDGIEKQIHQLRLDIEQAGLTGKVKAAICEYQITGGGWGPNRAFCSTQGVALFVAGVVALMVKNADLIEIGNFSNLTNAWWSSAIRTRREQSHATAPYHALSLYANTLSGQLVPCAVECERIDTGESKYITHDTPDKEERVRTRRMGIDSIPSQDAVAAYDSVKGEVTIAVMNYTAQETPLHIELDGFGVNGTPRVTYTAAPAMHWLNDFASPDRIIPIDGKLDTETMICTLSPCSLTMISIPVYRQTTD
jgi:alpha-N-arabinofuranosidase